MTFSTRQNSGEKEWRVKTTSKKLLTTTIIVLIAFFGCQVVEGLPHGNEVTQANMVWDGFKWVARGGLNILDGVAENESNYRGGPLLGDQIFGTE